jgi:hypothetical protein
MFGLNPNVLLEFDEFVYVGSNPVLAVKISDSAMPMLGRCPMYVE